MLFLSCFEEEEHLTQIQRMFCFFLFFREDFVISFLVVLASNKGDLRVKLA